MLKGGELGVLFNNIATYYKMNQAWWYKWKPTFQRWWEVEEMQYNPMWDRDGRRKFHEDIDDEGYNNNTHDDREVMDDDTTETSHSVTVSNTENDGTDHIDNAVSAYDAGNTMTPHDSSDEVSHAESQSTITTDVTAAGTDDRTTTKHGTSDTDMGNARDIDHAYREWGQWGISTISQNMYALQYKVRKQNNPYELMSDIFIKEMTDGVWV